MQNKLLLLEDVEKLGRSGDLVTVKPGYARNFLVPQKKAVVANKAALRLQARLIEEREKKAVVDRKESEEMVARLVDMTFSTIVKTDPDGHLYGSVSAADIVKILAAQGVLVDKHQVCLAHPIKHLGEHTIVLKLKEGVVAEFSLSVEADHPFDTTGVIPSEEETKSEG